MVFKFCSYPFCTSSSNTVCIALRRSRVLLNTDLLQATKSVRHFLIFSNKRFIGLPDMCAWVHDLRIFSSHSGWNTHFSSNLWILCSHRLFGDSEEVVSNSIGSWLDTPLTTQGMPTHYPTSLPQTHLLVDHSAVSTNTLYNQGPRSRN